MGTKQEVILIFLACGAVYVVGRFIIRAESKAVKKRVLKNIFMLYFFVYIFLLIKYTMLDGHFGRELGILKYIGNLETGYRDYIATKTNFNVFETIFRYTRALEKGSISLRLYLINIAGNTGAFIPFALFLPIFSKRAKNFFIFFIQVFFIGLGIEVTQILLMTGSFDVDDILLNVLGALVAYGIFHIKSIHDLLNKLTEDNY